MVVDVKGSVDNTKLAGILQSLSKGEQSRFQKFLESPYFNSSHDLLLLYQACIKLLGKNKSLRKITLWNKIAKGVYNDVRFRKFCSDLTKLLEQFLMQQTFDEDKRQQKIYLLKSLKGRNDAEKLRKSLLRSIEKEAKLTTSVDVEFYLHQYQLQRSFYEIFDYETQRSAKANLGEISEYLDLLYFSEKLRINCEVIQRSNFKAYDYNVKFSDYLIGQLEGAKLTEKSPLISLYYQVFLMWTEVDNIEQYRVFKTLLEKHGDIIPKEIAAEDFYGAALNYSIKRLNLGDRAFLKETFDLFLMMIDNDILVRDGRINPWYFRNIIVIGLRLGKYAWIEDFIHEYKIFLPEELGENAYTYNLAQLYMYQKKYSKVVELLQFVEYNDFSYNLNSKAMLLSTYYELDEFDLLESHLDAFDTFLKRRKDFPNERKNPYRDLIRFTRKLIRIIPGDKPALQKLREDIQSKKSVANANWLLEKIVSLEK